MLYSTITMCSSTATCSGEAVEGSECVSRKEGGMEGWVVDGEYGMLWYCGMVRYNMVWYGMVWYGEQDAGLVPATGSWAHY